VKRVKIAHPVLQKLLLSILTVILVGIIVFTTYYFTMNKENTSFVDSIYKYKVEVDKSNAIVVDAIKDIDNIDIKNTASINKIRAQILKASSTLQTTYDEIQKIKPPSKYEIQFSNYVNGIYSNRKIFMQTYLILKNTTSKDLDNAINALYKYVSDASKGYENSKLGKAYIALPSQIVAMPEKINQYAFKSFNDYQNRSRSLEEYQSYFKAMDDVLANFNSTKIDLAVNLEPIKQNTVSLDDVYIKIENKLSDMAQIQNVYSSLTLPAKMANKHQELDNILKAYTYYCQDFKQALTKFEEAGSDATAQADVTATFDDLKTKYDTLSRDFTDYVNAYNGDKMKYSDINNL
jgi:hypothetical protein